VDARDRLHAPAVAVAEAHAIDALGAAHVRRSVAADRNRLVGRQPARHAPDPQKLVADLAVDELVGLGQFGQAARHVRVHAGDELELRFAEVGRDVRVGERRPERCRMRRQREPAAGLHTQALFFDAAANSLQLGRRQVPQSLLQAGQAESP
jgi:hypothetical protein